VINPLRAEARSDHVQDFIASGHPVVFVGIAEGEPAVDIDNESGVRQAMSHLLDHGHRRIAFIAGHPEDIWGDTGKRLDAYRAFVREHNLASDERLVAYGLHTVQGGRQAMRQTLQNKIPFTAVLASNDESAIGALQALQEAGLRVPQDVALIGFDNRPEVLAQTPSLTTVHMPIFERGYRALELLLEHITGQKQDCQIVEFPTRLVIRQSCGCLSAPSLPSFRIPARQGTNRPVLSAQIAQTMADVVLADAQHLSTDDAPVFCRQLVDAYGSGLVSSDAADFYLTLGDILSYLDRIDDNIHVWQVAISVLEAGTSALASALGVSVSHRQVDEMLHQARIIISERIQQRHIQYLVDQRWIADQVGLLNARLITALDESRIFEILAEHLPYLGIPHAEVALFEPQGDDPVAWSFLRAIPERGESFFRFPSRQFPPEGLYPADRPFSLALLPLVSKVGSLGFVTFDTDRLDLYAPIVRQLAAALKSAELYREAAEGRRLAEEANRLKSRFLSTVSHELRTPLDSIVGLSDLLMMETVKDGHHLSPVDRRDVERIHSSAQHLNGLIRDVLDLAQSEVDQLKLACEPLDLAEVLQTVIVVGEQMARDKGLDWRAQIPENLLKVWGDRTRLRQVALNLVNNAIKFTTRGEVLLKVEAGEKTLTISVCDTGLGIPIEEQEMIFDEFRQSERTTARGYGGLGLGLAICKRLVEMHRGRIGVYSSGEESAGSTFYFTLPVMQDMSQRAAAAPRQQMVVLLTERSENASRVQSHLLHQGFQVEILYVDGSNGWLSLLLDSPPGALVLDIGMASERGWEILKVLKENPATQDIPLLFYALTQDRAGGAMLELDYLTKPVGIAELARALERQQLSKDRNKTILIADDEPGILEMHARVVQAQLPACRVQKARNGREALDSILQERPDLVLLDLMMPEMDGFGVLEVMQSQETLRDIPVIVLTGQGLTSTDMARLNQGVATVLEKGVFSVEETLVHIENALARVQDLGSDTQRLVRKAMAYIHEHYTETISRLDVANHAQVSVGYLSRSFKQETGVSPISYLNRYRVNQAKTLLVRGEKNITEVAMAVGFSDSNYFSRVFRREAGMSPTRYRNAHA
jgi:signal transduction histidine kinase/DNA-binding LacI/PurR family transcriptional regulator/PleD family two-component response regulator